MKKIKILIANPPSYSNFKYVKEGRCESKKGGQLTPQITLGIISKLLEQEGMKNDLYDFMATGMDNKTMETLKGYDLAIINVSAPSYESDKRFIMQLKTRNKGCLFCAIGVLSSDLPEYVIQDFDICVIGEPEITSKELALSLANEKSIHNVKGIVYKDKTNKVKYTQKREPLDNLDLLPFPDREKIPLNLYKNPMNSKIFTAINVQRGCPFHCNFCTATFYHGIKARYRSVDNVLDELKLCIEKYNITDFLFLADTFTLDKKFVINLCREIINNKLKISWSCNSRIDTFSYELGEIMSKAGCKFISFGVESASKRIIKENSKKTEPEKAIEATKICKKFRIVSMMYYILGFPGETENEMHSTVDLALKVDSDFARFFVATPLPGSKLFNDIYLNSYDFSKFNLAEISINKSCVDTPRLKQIIRYANIKFYFRISKAIRIISLFDNIFAFIYYAKEYLKNYILS